MIFRVREKLGRWKVHQSILINQYMKSNMGKWGKRSDIGDIREKSAERAKSCCRSV